MEQHDENRTEVVKARTKAQIPEILPMCDEVPQEAVDELLADIDREIEKAKARRMECERGLPKKA
jgi:ribosome-associated translation inhibitor RaiA